MMNKLILIFFLLITLLNKLYSQQIIQLDGKFAVMNRNNVVVANGFDSIIEDQETFDDENTFYTFFKKGKSNVIFKKNLESTNWNAFECHYSIIKANECRSTTAISFMVKENGKYGVIDENFVFMAPLQLDSIYQTKKNSKFLILKKGDKYDFLDIVLDVDSVKNLKFEYDEIYTETQFNGFMNLRVGNKYGCYFIGFDGNRYKRGFVDVIYDSLIKPYGYFLSTFKNKQQHYFYTTSNLTHAPDFVEFELFCTDSTHFTNIRTKESLLFIGRNKNEQALFSYPNLFIDYMNNNGFTTLDLSANKKIPLFEPVWNTTFHFDKLLFSKDQIDKEAFPFNIFIVRTNNGINTTETIYSINNLKMLITRELKESQMIAFIPYKNNSEYKEVVIANRETDLNGKMKIYSREGYLSGFYIRIEANRPENSTDFSLGGKSRGNSKWMDFIWMGGR